MTPRDRESAGYAECERITRRHGTTYYWGARLLTVMPVRLIDFIMVRQNVDVPVTRERAPL